MRSFSLLAALGPAIAYALPSPLAGPTTTGVSAGQLFAFGAGISGLPVFYDGGVAYLGNTSLIGNSSTVTDINFTLTDEVLTASPITSNSTIANSTLYIDASGSAKKAVLATSAPSSAYSNSGFGFFGDLLIYESNSVVSSKWSATKATTSGLWVLEWTDDISDDTVQVAIRNINL